MAPQQILEFTLGDEQYCIAIEYVSEIVGRSRDDVTPIPNSPANVEGVMDLRGETTKIVDLQSVLAVDVDVSTTQDKVIIFGDEATDGETLGWAVTDVRSVSTADPGNVEETDQEALEGLISRDDGFLIWVDPAAIFDTA